MTAEGIAPICAVEKAATAPVLNAPSCADVSASASLTESAET